MEKFIIDNFFSIISTVVSMAVSLALVKANYSQLRKEFEELKQSHIFTKQEQDKSNLLVASSLGKIEGQVGLLVDNFINKKK